MTLEPAVHCSRVRKLAVGVANESPSLTHPKFYSLSHARCFLAWKWRFINENEEKLP